jgi:hypothetical protein
MALSVAVETGSASPMISNLVRWRTPAVVGRAGGFSRSNCPIPGHDRTEMDEFAEKNLPYQIDKSNPAIIIETL